MRLPPALLFLASATILMAATPTPSQAASLAVCNAQHKRPANPYGSVLSEGLKPAVASTAPNVVGGAVGAPSASAPATSPAAKPQQVSRSEWRASFAPCRSDRA